MSDSATPWAVAYQASPSMGFFRQEYWSELPFPSPINNNNNDYQRIWVLILAPYQPLKIVLTSLCFNLISKLGINLLDPNQLTFPHPHQTGWWMWKSILQKISVNRMDVYLCWSLCFSEAFWAMLMLMCHTRSGSDTLYQELVNK